MANVAFPFPEIPQSAPRKSVAASLILAFILVLLASPALLHAGRDLPPAPRADSSRAVALTVLSIPPEADVLLDGTMVGRTPLQLFTVRPGRHELRVSKSGFCDFLDTLSITGASLVREVRMDSSCGVNITSAPDSAGVYLDNVYVGKSPLRLTNVRPGWKSVKVVKTNWALWENRVLLSPGNLVEVNASMQSKFGTLNLEVFSEAVTVTVDGKDVGSGSLTDYMIPAGWHDIGAMKVDRSDSVSETIYIQPGETVHREARFDVPSRRAFWLSLAVPGLGQMADRSQAEGTTLMAGFIASGAFALIMELKYLSEANTLSELRGVYERATGEDQAKVAGDAYQSQFNELKTPRTLRTVGLVAAGAIYLYSLFEAFVNHPTVDTISPIASQDDHRIDTEVAFTTTGFRFSLRMNF